VDFDAPSNVVTDVRLVGLPSNGAWSILREVVVGQMFVVGAPAGDILQEFSFQTQIATRSTTSGALTFGVPISRTATVDDAGYQPPGPPAGAGIPVAFAIAANELVLRVGSVAVAGFTIRTRIRGQLWTFDGATRLVA
jgi:hypothetical protein